MALVLGLDPGATCGIVRYDSDTRTILYAGESAANCAFISISDPDSEVVVVEDYTPQFTPTGHDTVKTCKLIGYLECEARHQGKRFVLLTREEVLAEIIPEYRSIESAWRRAKKDALVRGDKGVPKPNRDRLVRMALVLKFGGDNAIGKKASPGPLYGFKGLPHCFSALGLCLAFAAREERGEA